MTDLINPNPIVHERKATTRREPRANNATCDETTREPIDDTELFEYLRRQTRLAASETARKSAALEP